MQGKDKEFNKVLATGISDGQTLKRTSKDIGIKHGLDFSSNKKRKQEKTNKQVDTRLDELFIIKLLALFTFICEVSR